MKACRVQRAGEGCRVQRAKAIQEDAADIREKSGRQGNQYWEKPRGNDKFLPEGKFVVALWIK